MAVTIRGKALPLPILQVKAFIRILEQAGVNVTVRRKLGSDVDASCGQLRKKVADHRA